MDSDITFEQLLEKLKHIKFRRTAKDWEIYLPYSPANAVQDVIQVCRGLRLTTWHVVFSEATEEGKRPEIHIYWETA